VTNDPVEHVRADPVQEVTAWLQEHWDPDLTVGEWWERLGKAGWSAPTLPTEWYGRGLSTADSARVHRAIRDFGALGPPGGLGLLLAAPTIVAHGTDEQKRRYIEDIVCGREGWCQLFSEPAAGSDLAGLQTRAVRDGAEWVINGQKVWTSNAQIADRGMLLARTNPDVPKHRGLTYFLLDMHQPGVDVRPLRELTGRSLFNEVFLTDVRVRDDDILGGLDAGWAVANTTLAFERTGTGAGADGTANSSAAPGTIAGHLTQRAGDFVRGRQERMSLTVRPELYIEAARRHAKVDDPLTRQHLVALYIENEVGRYLTLRLRALRASGSDIPGAPNIAKLRMSELFRLGREVGLGILGARGMLHDYRGHDRSNVNPDRAVLEIALWSPAPSIYGGSDQIQRNILAERVLGLPREPGDERSTPFRDLRKNV